MERIYQERQIYFSRETYGKQKKHYMYRWSQFFARPDISIRRRDTRKRFHGGGDYEWARDLHIFFLETRTTFFQEFCLEFGIGRWDDEVRASDESVND